MPDGLELAAVAAPGGVEHDGVVAVGVLEGRLELRRGERPRGPVRLRRLPEQAGGAVRRRGRRRHERHHGEGQG